jgi:hypothetical protein
MVLKLSASLKAEFEDRGWRTDGEGFGRPVGLVWTVGQLAGIPLGFAANFLGPQQLGDPAVALALGGVLIVIGLALFVCWIVYWVQMAQYGRRLRQDRGRYGYRPGSLEEDYDDEYRGRRREAIEEDDDYDRPRRRRDDDYVDEDDRPRRQRDDEVDDEDDRPRRRERDEY